MIPTELGHAFFREGRCVKLACTRTGTFLSLGRKAGEAWEWAHFRLRISDIGTMLALMEGNIPAWQFDSRQGDQQRLLGVQAMRTGLRVELDDEEWFMNLGEVVIGRRILEEAIPYEIRASQDRRIQDWRVGRRSSSDLTEVDEEGER